MAKAKSKNEQGGSLFNFNLNQDDGKKAKTGKSGLPIEPEEDHTSYAPKNDYEAPRVYVPERMRAEAEKNQPSMPGNVWQTGVPDAVVPQGNGIPSAVVPQGNGIPQSVAPMTAASEEARRENEAMPNGIPQPAVPQAAAPRAAAPQPAVPQAAAPRAAAPQAAPRAAAPQAAVPQAAAPRAAAPQAAAPQAAAPHEPRQAQAEDMQEARSKVHQYTPSENKNTQTGNAQVPHSKPPMRQGDIGRQERSKISEFHPSRPAQEAAVEPTPKAVGETQSIQPKAGAIETNGAQNQDDGERLYTVESVLADEQMRNSAAGYSTNVGGETAGMAAVRENMADGFVDIRPQSDYRYFGMEEEAEARKAAQKSAEKAAEKAAGESKPEAQSKPVQADTGSEDEGDTPLSKFVRDINARSDEQGLLSKRNAEKIDKISSQIETTSHVVKVLSDRSRDLDNAKASVQDTLDRLSKTNEKIETTAKIISDQTRKMSAASASMQEITSLVSAMASEMSLLSKNASEEALKAGDDTGRGFGAVATRMRELGNQASGSAKQIKEIIDVFAKAMNDATSTMKKTLELAESQSGDIKSTDEAFKSIDKSLSGLSDGVSAVEKSMDEMNDLRDSAVNSSEQLLDFSSRQQTYSVQSVRNLIEMDKYSSTINDSSAKLGDLAAMLKSDIGNFGK